MDQTSEQASHPDDFYAEYVEKLRAQRKDEEAQAQTVPSTVTCHVEMDADVADAVLDLIAQHFTKYSVRSQGFLLRASKSIETGIRQAAESLAKPHG